MDTTLNRTLNPNLHLNERAENKPAPTVSFFAHILRAAASLFARQDDPAALRYIAGKYDGLGD